MMNPLIKLKYIKELKGYLKQDLMGLPVLEKLATIKRMRELIQLLGGNAASVKEEISKAQNATQLAGLMQKAIDESKDIPNAFKRDDMNSPIDLRAGNQKSGLIHIVEQRTKDGTLSIISQKELFEAIALTILSGNLEVQAETKGNQRIKITKNDSCAVLAKNSNENAWILTGWAISNEKLEELKKLPPGERRSVFLTDAPTIAISPLPENSVGAEGFGDNSTDDEAINQESNVVFLQRVIQGEVEPNNSAMSRMKVIIHNPEPTDEDKNLLDKALEVWFKKLVSLVESEERN